MLRLARFRPIPTTTLPLCSVRCPRGLQSALVPSCATTRHHHHRRDCWLSQVLTYIRPRLSTCCLTGYTAAGQWRNISSSVGGHHCNRRNTDSNAQIAVLQLEPQRAPRRVLPHHTPAPDQDNVGRPRVSGALTFLSITSIERPRPFSRARQRQISARTNGASLAVFVENEQTRIGHQRAGRSPSICCSPPDSRLPILPSAFRQTWKQLVDTFSSVQALTASVRPPLPAGSRARTDSGKPVVLPAPGPMPHVAPLGKRRQVADPRCRQETDSASASPASVPMI